MRQSGLRRELSRTVSPDWFSPWSKEVKPRNLVSELFTQGSVGGAAGNCCLYPATRIATLRCLEISFACGGALASKVTLLPSSYSDGVDYSWFWQRKDGQYFFELFPYHFSLVVSAVEPVPPPSHRLLMYFLKLTIVTANTIILIVPS